MGPRAPRALESDARRIRVRFREVRRATVELCRPLAIEDHVVQSMPDASPTKWHLAHTTWFFEEFVLRAADPRTDLSSDTYRYLFNSYYRSVGEMHARASRGLLSRPTVAEVMDYRARVDERMGALLEADELPESLTGVLALGLAHEEQHQELLLTDILHAFAANPLRPSYANAPGGERAPLGEHATGLHELRFVRGREGIARIGSTDEGFTFDNERPAHDVLLRPHALAQRPISNAEFRSFVRDGGYQQPALWLSEGWATVESERWQRPLYWSEDLASQFSLRGTIALIDAAPVSHISYFEADAFARWAGARLPTEHEWECAARDVPVTGNFRESGELRAVPAAMHSAAPTQLFGDVWEWTQSPYVAYPGFRTANTGLGEYNGKFMINQVVLRGGSALTPGAHMRATYRNFFHPAARWQMSGLRLAQDL